MLQLLLNPEDIKKEWQILNLYISVTNLEFQA